MTLAILAWMRAYNEACHFVSDASVALVSLVATAWLIANWKGFRP